LIPNQESRFAGGFNLRSTVRICLWCGHHALQRLHLNSLFGAELLLLTPLHRNFPQKGVPRIGMRRASTPARNRVNQAMFPTMIRPKSRAVPAKRFFLFWIGICVAGFLPALRAQTFEIGNQPAQSSPNAPAHKGKAKSSSPPSSSSEGIGWGNSIELGRVARAAEQALHKGNYAAATEYAQRAVQSAPQNAKLWFLLGYTSRLAGKYQISIDAYNRGLSIMPASPEGLSGMAQTYSRAGNIDEAKSLLNQVLKAHPDRIEDLLMLGELYIRTDEIQQGLNLLWRGEAKKPSDPTELLMATAYMRL